MNHLFWGGVVVYDETFEAARVVAAIARAIQRALLADGGDSLSGSHRARTAAVGFLAAHDLSRIETAFARTAANARGQDTRWRRVSKRAFRFLIIIWLNMRWACRVLKVSGASGKHILKRASGRNSSA